jgi:hypothetical protein
MEDNWENPYEDDGVTLGPEEALLRETEKTKALKVEKLKLKATIEKLKNKNNILTDINQSLEQQLRSSQSPSNPSLKVDQTYTVRSAYLLLIFNLIALIILILFHLNL